MKKWKMNIQAMTSIIVKADSYDQAIEKGLETAMEQSVGNDLIWTNFKIIEKSVEIDEKEKN